MTRKLTAKNLLVSIRERKAASCYDFLAYCGLTLSYNNGGQYRNVYNVIGCEDYLIKAPITQGRYRKSAIRHAKAEYEAYRRIMKNKGVGYEALKPFMPEIVGMIPSSGVMVVKKYAPLGKLSKDERALILKVNTLAGKLFGRYCDLHDGNYRRDTDGSLKIIDLGYFLPQAKFKTKPRVKHAKG